MRNGPAAGMLVAILMTAPPAQGQGQDCDLEVLRTPGSMGAMVTLPSGEVRIDQWGGVEAVCGDRRLSADSDEVVILLTRQLEPIVERTVSTGSSTLDRQRAAQLRPRATCA